MVESSDSSPLQAAKRELSEEFLVPLCTLNLDDTNIRPFTIKQTRPVRSRSNMMLCYIALESENEWLKRLDVEKTNERLRQRRATFNNIVKRDGMSFYENTSKEEREKITPEVHQIQWMSLRDAVRHALSSLCQEEVYVNDFQKNMFQKLHRRRRDPMFITAALLMELETFPDELSVIEYCKSNSLQSLRHSEQWLFNGMTEEDTKQAFVNRYKNGFNKTFKGPATVKRLKDMRKRRMIEISKL